MGKPRKSTLTVLLLMLAMAMAVTGFAAEGITSAKGGTISGQFLTAGGEALADGVVYFFNTKVGPPPDHEKYWRVPDVKKRLDNEGRFSIVLPEGSYYVSATKKSTGKEIGPPREGDYYFICTDEHGIPVAYSVKNNEQINLGTIAGALPFKSATVNFGKGISAIEGVVLDKEGNPVSGVFVVAFVSGTTSRKPLFISDPTGKDGSFILRVHESGTYFLKVRSTYGGGPPAPGEMIGIYGGKQPAAVSVKKGERLTGFTIRMSSGRGPQMGN